MPSCEKLRRAWEYNLLGRREATPDPPVVEPRDGCSTTGRDGCSTTGGGLSTTGVSARTPRVSAVESLCSRRPGGSRSRRRGSPTSGTCCRPCACSSARWRAPDCSRSTRSTCCSGRTTCRSTPGWLLRRRPAAARGRGAPAPGGRVLGARPGVHAGRALARDAVPDGALAEREFKWWPGIDRMLRQRCWRRSEPRAGHRRDLDDGTPRAKASGTGTGPPPARRSTSST